jgi:hypothetical protein
LGFDVACYHRETDKELWRVVFEGRNKRLKVYPDGQTERFDGKDNFPKCQPMTEVLRAAPSNDKAKIEAAVSVFKRYATVSIGFTALAHYLSQLGWRNGCGGYFQHQQIEEMLADPIYLGYHTWNKWHFGKFHRYAKGQTVPELNYGEKGSRNDKADWVQSRRLFEPLVDRATWDAVQRKLGERSKRPYTPRSAAQYLAGLVYCGNCGCPMVAGPTRRPTSKPRMDGHTGERYEYRCGTYFKAVREKRREECKCLRNGVFQDTLEEYVHCYLEETNQRLQLLTGGLDASLLTDPLERQETVAWSQFRDGIDRLTSYLAEHHPEEYGRMLEEYNAEQEALEAAVKDSRPARPGELVKALGPDGRKAFEKAKAAMARGDYSGVSPGDFIDRCLDCYRSVFDPSAVAERLAELEAEHTTLTQQCLKLTTERAITKANQQLAVLETQIGELEKQREDAADVVAGYSRQMCELQHAIADAKFAMKSQEAECALRQRAEALRAVVQRIECSFTATGQTGDGWGKKNSRLVTVTIYPVVGDSLEFSADGKGTVMYSSAHSFMNRTRAGRMR